MALWAPEKPNEARDVHATLGKVDRHSRPVENDLQPFP